MTDRPLAKLSLLLYLKLPAAASEIPQKYHSRRHMEEEHHLSSALLFAMRLQSNGVGKRKKQPQF
jgi:hypothetical protein